MLKLQHTTEFGIPVLISAKNPLLKEIRRAVERGGLTTEGLCIAETFHLVEEALKSGCRVAAIVANESSAEQAERLACGTEVIRVADSAFRSVAATETSQGVLALVEPPAQSIERILCDPALAVVLDGIQDPGNAGAILRTAEAFGASGAVLLKGTANPYNPKAIRASAGSIFRLPVVSGVLAEDFSKTAQERDITIYAAMPRADLAVADVDFRRRCAIVVGSEGRGVSRKMSEVAQAVRIPTKSVESLNAAVAAGVLLYEAARQRTP